MTDSSTTSTKPILGYWKIRGLASAIRYQLAYSKVSFDEEVYEQGDAPGFDNSEWLNVKFKQGLSYPNLPYLKDGPLSLTESGAIHRYCAKKWCPELLCVDDAELYGKAEMAWGVYSDLKYFATMGCYCGDGDKKLLGDKSINRFELVAKTLSGNKFLAGDRICIADFAMVELIEMMNCFAEGELFTAHNSLKEYRDRMFALPNMEEARVEEEKHTFNNKCSAIN